MSEIPAALLEKAAQALLESWRAQGGLTPPFNTDHADALADAHAVLSAVWEEFSRDVLAAVDDEVRQVAVTASVNARAEVAAKLKAAATTAENHWRSTCRPYDQGLADGLYQAEDIASDEVPA